MTTLLMKEKMIAFVFIVLLVLTLSYAQKDCSGEQCQALSAFGTALKRDFEGSSLIFVSGGIRAKNIVITTVNVYTVSLYVSDELENQLKNDNVTDNFDGYFTGRESQDVSFAITLTFLRNVGKGTMIDALIKALSGQGNSAYEESVHEFKEALLSSISSSGINKGDELSFVWRGDQLGVAAKGERVWISNADLAKRLASVYLGASPVAPDVLANLRRFALSSPSSSVA